MGCNGGAWCGDTRLTTPDSVRREAQGGGEVVARRARWGLLITAGVVVVGAANQVVTNYATPLAPGWLRDPWHVWSVVVGLVLVLVIFALITERSREGSGVILAPGGVSAPVRFAVAPSSLRPPHVEPGALRGRDGELACLAGLVARRPVEGVGGLVVVAGPGGIGKTSLVAAAAADAVRAGRVVFWMRWRAGDTAESLTARMVEAATTLGLPRERVGAAQEAGGSLVDLVWAHLEATPGWVVVVDNLDQPAALSGDGEPVGDYRGWIRPSRAGLVVVSSRDQDPATWGPSAQLIRLDPLDAQAGAEVLLRAAPRAGSVEEARELSVRLGGLPLVLRAAGRAVSEPTAALRSFSAYQQALTSQSITVLPDLPASPDASNPEIVRRLVGYTWELSLDQLVAEGLPLARPLLRLAALLAEAPIPRSLLTRELLAQVTGSDVSTAALDGALAGLGRYGLLEVPDPARTHQIPTLAVHPLVRETTLLLTQTTDPQPWHEALSRRLIAQVTDTAAAGRGGWDLALLLAPHLPLLTGLRSTDPDTFRAARDALDTLANQLNDAGAFAAEFELRQTVLHTEERILGDEHPYTLNSRNNLANALYELGEYRRAAELHQQTLTTHERILGDEHPHTLASRNNLALALRGLGEYRRAAELHQQTLTTRERGLGDEHPDTLASRNNLANVLDGMGEYRRAAELHQQTLTTRERGLGDEHPDTLKSRNNLALALGGMGEYRRAAELHQQTLTTRERILGDEHPETLKSRNNLALALYGLGEYRRAAELHQQTLTARERVLGDEHPHTLGSRNDLANALNRLAGAHGGKRRLWWWWRWALAGSVEEEGQHERGRLGR
jgi:tetratricopeptide (TPR) repeat protein